MHAHVIDCLRVPLIFVFSLLCRLGRNMDGRVKITHLADGFVKDYKGIHSVGDLVTAKVLE